MLAQRSLLKPCRMARKFMPTLKMKSSKSGSETLTEESLEETVEDSNRTVTTTSYLAKRFTVTAEVLVSKIFPAGFGWQFGSIGAAHAGYSATDVGFAVATGFGDFSGVLLGHALYYTVKSRITGGIDLKKEYSTGLLLGSAAFFSGFAWQPSVNFFQGLEAPFLGVSIGTWATCGAAFFGGLRLFRTIYSPVLLVDNVDQSNLANDALLSVSIGGAAGGFVGTDTAYLNGDGNFLRPYVGVETADSYLTSCTKAGAATSIGFTAAQSVQNVAAPASSKIWTD